jgi:hypothetical protein
MKIGYARVSTRENNFNMQVIALEEEGCEKIYEEIISGMLLLVGMTMFFYDCFFTKKMESRALQEGNCKKIKKCFHYYYCYSCQS